VKRLVLLGCATGIGNAGAKALAARGYALALGDIDAAGVERLAVDLRSEGAEARAFVLDASDTEAVTRFVNDGAAALGGLDAAWSNVGVQIAGTAEEITAEHLDRSFAINVRAHAVLCGAAIPHLRAAGGGAVLVTASNSALLSEPRLLPYAVTKAAALALARQIARDYASERIRVNALCPGWVDTPFNEPSWANFGGREAFLDAMPGLVPLGRISTPDEIAQLACFLLSDEAAYVTGQAFVADGGETLG
jgi:NAD(P)-dependent dehydrogenase (short-subunit alcohol dehydrogenase family)